MEISRETKRLISQYHIFPSDKLGQNFLIGASALQFIVDAINPQKDKSYIEVGAGFLFITKMVASNGKRVFAIEKDKRFGTFYDEFKESSDEVANKIEIIQGDALKIDFSLLDADEIFGNIPYYISSELLVKIANTANIKRGIILFQKEFADRILSYPKESEYGAITVLIDFYFDKKFLKTFPPSFFFPRPSVSSAFVELKRHAAPGIDSENFFKLVRSAFGMRRKKLVNNLKADFSLDRLLTSLDKLSIRRDVRAEELSVSDFVKLFNELSGEL